MTRKICEDGPTYRDVLVNIIKDCGQDIIDRAEEMVSEKCKGITDLNITIHIPANIYGDEPIITFSTDVLCKTYLKNRYDIEL